MGNAVKRNREEELQWRVVKAYATLLEARKIRRDAELMLAVRRWIIEVREGATTLLDEVGLD